MQPQWLITSESAASRRESEFARAEDTLSEEAVDR